MAQLRRSAAALRIIGDALVPEEISAMIGGQPSTAYRKGERFGGPDGLRSQRKSGQWALAATDCTPADIDSQIAEILGKLTGDLAIWTKLGASYRVDLFCGWFMDGFDEGLEISPESLAALGARGITLAICLYAPLED